MVQLGANDPKFNVVLKDILNNFFGISNLEGNDKMGVFSFKITHEFGEEIFSGNGACPQRKFSFDPLGEFAQGIQ